MSTTKKTKLCPYCAETIKASAIVCRYCGRDLPLAAKTFQPIDHRALQLPRDEPVDSAPSIDPAEKQASERVAKNSRIRLSWILSGAVAIALCFCWVFFYVLDDLSTPDTDSGQPIANTQAATGDLKLYPLILTTEEIDQITPGLWLPAEPSDTPFSDDNNFISKSWQTDNGFLDLAITMHRNASAAEAEIQIYMLASSDIDYVKQILPRVEYLPDHTWLGVKRNTVDNVTELLLFTQDREYLISSWLLIFGPPLNEEDILLQTKMLFLITGEQWDKINGTSSTP